MGEFFTDYDRKKLVRILNKITGIYVDETGRKHGLAKCETNGEKETIPRHTIIKDYEVDNIGKFLLDKCQREELRKHFKFLK